MVSEKRCFFFAALRRFQAKLMNKVVECSKQKHTIF